jgi:hypothetical protein
LGDFTEGVSDFDYTTGIWVFVHSVTPPPRAHPKERAEDFMLNSTMLSGFKVDILLILNVLWVGFIIKTEQLPKMSLVLTLKENLMVL